MAFWVIIDYQNNNLINKNFKNLYLYNSNILKFNVNNII